MPTTPPVTLRVLHPAPLLVHARRGTAPRTAYERIETHVTLRDVEDRWTPDVGEMDQGTGAPPLPIHLLDGHLYAPILSLPAPSGDPGAWISGLLDGTIPPRDVPQSIRDLTVGTPLRIMDPSRRHEMLRGEDPGTFVAGVLGDGRDRAREDLTSFVRRELVVADGRLLHRVPNGLAYPVPRQPGVYQACRFPRDRMFSSLFMSAICGPGGLAAHRAYAVSLGKGDAGHPDPSIRGIGIKAPLPGRLSDDDDLEVVANAGLVAMMHRHGTLVRAAGGTLAEAGVIRDAARAVSPFLALARIGSLRPDEAFEALLGVDALLRATLARCPDTTPNIATLAGEARYLREAILPRLAAPVPEADAAALDGLAP